MQTRRTNLDHHHQGLFLNKEVEHFSPEAELIALARSKGQVLAQRTLQIIRDTLELRGVSLAEFVADVRPHFRNNILNPSGFLIDRARHFHALSQPAVVRVPPKSTPETAAPHCGSCNGQRLVIKDKKIQPCPQCSTPEFRKEWEMKEAERARNMRSGLTAVQSESRTE